MPRPPRSWPSLLLALAACGGGGDLSTSSATDPLTTGSTTSGPGPTSASSGDIEGTTAATTGPTGGGPTASTGATDTGSSSTGAGAGTDATGEASSSGAGTTGGADDLPPTQGDALEVWLAAGSYKSWAAESKVHMSTGPHGGNVRTYLNPALFDSLTAKNAMHPQGAAVVKELYSGGMDTITGYAVMVKVAPDSGGGEGWYWYERAGGTTYADGTGVGLCSGCHVGGADYVLTPFPLQ